MPFEGAVRTYVSGTSVSALVTGKGKLYGIIVTSSTSVASIVTAYDALTPTGTQLTGAIRSVANSASAIVLPLAKPIPFSVGLSILITGTGGTAEYTVLYV